MIKEYECLLINMGWSVDDILGHYEDNGFHVWEFLPTEGRVWLEAKARTPKVPTVMQGIYG